MSNMYVARLMVNYEHIAQEKRQSHITAREVIIVVPPFAFESKVHCSSDWCCSLVTYLLQSPQRANCLLFNKSVNALSVLQLILGDFLPCLSSLVALARRDWNGTLYKSSRQYVSTSVQNMGMKAKISCPIWWKIWPNICYLRGHIW